jgi:excisionase family DNA binding protein
VTDVLVERLLTAKEVAAILRVTERYVWRLGREGALERIKPPGRKYVLFPESTVRRYLEHGRATPVHAGAAAARPESEPAQLRDRAIQLTTRRRRLR